KLANVSPVLIQMIFTFKTVFDNLFFRRQRADWV
ncbi:MAG: hypothetical protein ACI9RO_002116, partial [Alteromonas macleodii]